MQDAISRRRFLALAGSTATAPFIGLEAAAGPAGSLAAAAAQAGLLFGASIANEAFEDPAYAALYLRQTRIVTTDVALKFDYLRPDAETYDFADADRILDFARGHDLQVRGHTLIWNENAPDWLKRLSGHEIERVFDAHIERVAARYAGRLHSWDVVNEPFWPGHGKPGGYRTGPWFAALAQDYIARAFRRVAAIDPLARLVLNEAHTERMDAVGRDIRAGLLVLIDRLLDDGVRIDAVGLQAHLQPQIAYDDEAFGDFVERLAERGVAIYITELDVNDEAFSDPIEERDARVADRYRSFLSRVLAIPAVKLVMTWQLADRYSYQVSEARRDGRRLPRPLPFDENFNPKPAYFAMKDAFAAAMP